MSKKYDVIVIGGGHNGLTAATVLARKNKKVLVVEKRPIAGGIAAGEEFHPGYFTTGLLHDTSAVRSQVIRDLGLGKFGLQTNNRRAAVSVLSKDGNSIELGPDLSATCASIARVSPKDADAYKAYRSFIDAISPFVKGLMDGFPLDLGNLGGSQLLELAKKGLALKRMGKKTMLEFMKVAPMSVADFLNEKFETGFLKAGMAGPAIYGSFNGPLASYTTLNLLLWECLAQESVAGGPQALVTALVKAATEAGVEIRTNAEVAHITLDTNRKAAGVKLMNGEEISGTLVAASCTPYVTFYQLLKPDQISYTLEHAIRHYRSRGTTAKVNLAVNKSVNFNGVSGVVFARTGNSFLEMEKAFDAVKYRKFSDEPVLDIHVPSQENASLAPVGHSVVSILVHFAPHHFDEGWSDQTKSKLLNQVLKTLSQYAPDISSSMVASEVLSPPDLEARYSLTQGHIFHGEHAVDQIIARPVPSCAQYATPIEGLFLCGSGSHPGGGITCMPGYLGAKMILKNT